MKKILLVLLTDCFAASIFSQNSLHLSGGSSVKLSNSAQVVLDNTDLINNGTISLSAGDGTFKFKGNINTNISGSNKPVFDILELDKSSTQLILQRDIDVIGNIIFTSGIFHLNGHVVDLGSTGLLLNENESNRFIGPNGGYIQFASSLNSPASANPGNLGAIISSTQSLGTTIIRRGHVAQSNVGTGSSILRYYDILPTVNTNLNATLRFTYFDAELNSLNENSLNLWKSTDNVNWSFIGFDAQNLASNFVEKNSIDNFSRWTLGGPASALPVKFSVFNTRCEGTSVTVRWTTETEINSSRFEIQKSVDGRNWSTITSLPSSGNSSMSRQYSFTDNVPGQNAFYRIAEFDIDGRVNYSPVNHVNCGVNTEVKLWPNPSLNQAWLLVTAATSSKTTVKIVDQKGSVVYSKETELFAGTNIINIDTHSLPAGNYIVELVGQKKTSFLKMVKP